MTDKPNKAHTMTKEIALTLTHAVNSECLNTLEKAIVSCQNDPDFNIDEHSAISKAVRIKDDNISLTFVKKLAPLYSGNSDYLMEALKQSVKNYSVERISSLLEDASQQTKNQLLRHLPSLPYHHSESKVHLNSYVETFKQLITWDADIESIKQELYHLSMVSANEPFIEFFMKYHPELIKQQAASFIKYCTHVNARGDRTERLLENGASMKWLLEKDWITLLTNHHHHFDKDNERCSIPIEKTLVRHIEQTESFNSIPSEALYTFMNKALDDLFNSPQDHINHSNTLLWMLKRDLVNFESVLSAIKTRRNKTNTDELLLGLLASKNAKQATLSCLLGIRTDDCAGFFTLCDKRESTARFLVDASTGMKNIDPFTIMSRLPNHQTIVMEKLFG